MDIFKLSYQCNLCKPKVSVISANVESRSNLKRHLSNLHGSKVIEKYEESIKKRKLSKSSSDATNLVQVIVVKKGVIF